MQNIDIYDVINQEIARSHPTKYGQIDAAVRFFHTVFTREELLKAGISDDDTLVEEIILSGMPEVAKCVRSINLLGGSPQ